jgi:hypothetical protein
LKPLSRSDSTVDSEASRPRYSFKITGYRNKDFVEYTVVLTENKEIRGKNCASTYQFNTRYSKLLALHDKMKPSATFPPKKILNSRKPEFLEKRKEELEKYLNEIALDKNDTLNQFVLQIKKASLNSDIAI